MIVPNPCKTQQHRGAFIVFEGVDRCGKTTQCSLLLKHLLSVGIAAIAMQFPNRTTCVGQLINSYLSSSSSTSHNDNDDEQQQQHLDDHAIHLLFSANRWEAAPKLAATLAGGETVVCDRYAYSGVAFSSAKEATDDVSGESPPLTIDWCKNSDVGLPAPDVVIFLDLSQEEAEQRGGYGEERYEKRDMQIRVKERFTELRNMDDQVPWHVVNAAQTVEKVHSDILAIVEDTVQQVVKGKPLSKLWTDGDYPLRTKQQEE